MLSFTPASTNIAAVEYDEATRQLVVEFNDGDRYSYGNVPASVYKAFAAAPSAGSFFHRQIKGKYSFAQV